MLTRRLFLNATAAAALSAQSKLTPRQRVDRALAGQSVDRPPISLWHHFGLEKQGPAKHAEATLAFHRNNRTDLVKVMSDFPIPEAWDRRVVGSEGAEESAVINYSVSDTKVALAATRKRFSGVLMGGIDEDAYPKLSVADLKAQAAKARQEVGAKFILTPGCSVPNDTPADRLKLLAQAVG